MEPGSAVRSVEAAHRREVADLVNMVRSAAREGSTVDIRPGKKGGVELVVYTPRRNLPPLTLSGRTISSVKAVLLAEGYAHLFGIPF